MEIGQNIRDLRKSKGMVIRELAAKANLAEAYICKLENNQVCPGLKMVERVAKALDCTVIGLLSHNQNVIPSEAEKEQVA